MSRKAPVTQCRLCRKTDKLRHSHIIPEFFYKPLYDGDHKIKVLSTDGARKSPIQKGLREYLLCDECEQRFCQYERYVNNLIYHGAPPKATQSATVLIIHNVDYARFKLFVMSLLWRMGVAQHEMFAAVALGEHEEKLRLALLTENPLAPMDYPFFVQAVYLGGKFMGDFTAQAGVVATPNQPIFRVLIAGFLFVLHLVPIGMLLDMQDILLRREGDLFIQRQDAENLPKLKEFFLKVGQVGKLVVHR